MLEKSNERNQLRKMVGSLLDEFGAMGKYKKPYYTPTLRVRKNNEFVFPHKYELISMMRDLRDKNYDTSEIHTRYLALKQELLERKDK